MKTGLRIFFGIAFLGQVACADFFNSANKTAPSDRPREKNEANPFPADYDPTVGPFSESKMLAHLGLNIISPVTSEFRLRLENLQLELESWRSALDNGDVRMEQAAATRVESLWKRAMLTYHHLDAVPIGPASDDNGVLAQQIYGWPDFNACGIDLEMVKYASSGKVPKQLLYTMKGLGAVEYLVFDKSLGTQCNRNNPRNRPAVEWTQKEELSKWRDRVAFALVLTRDLITKARQLETAWDPQGPNFAKVLVDGSRFPSLREATNALSDAIFSLEELKDYRLGRPLGLHKDCLSEEKKCPTQIEHPWSHIGLQAVSARLAMLLAVVRGSRNAGGAGFGVQNLLAENGHADLGENFTQIVQKTLDNARAVEGLGTLLSQITAMDVTECQNSTGAERRVPVCALFQDVRELNTFMKTEFLSALSLRAPPKFQGDND